MNFIIALQEAIRKESLQSNIENIQVAGTASCDSVRSVVAVFEVREVRSAAITICYSSGGDH